MRVTGGEDFLKVSKALKAAGRTGLRKALHKGLQEGAKPLIPGARDSARRTLPQSGGLAGQVAKAPMRVRVRTGATPGVAVVVGKNRSGARAANRGQVAHPVFGNRDRWVRQAVPDDWFDGYMERNAPKVRPDLQRVIDRVLDDVVKGVR